MIYVTGDTHGLRDFGKLSELAANHPELTKNDYVIIAGDFSGARLQKDWEDMLLPYQKLPFTVLFVDGNHENFKILNAYPEQVWKGGRVHFLKPDIIHLMRAQVFEIEGKTIFTFGGGTSVDRALRTEGFDWWPQEMPNYQELDEAVKNLQRYDNEVDFIITHSCDQRALYYAPIRVSAEIKGVQPDNQILSYFEDNVHYKHWYFGHYHIDAELTDKKTVLFQKIVPLT